MNSLGKFDSQILVDIFKADADNLLDFDGLAELLGDGEDDSELMLLPEQPELLLQQPAVSPGPVASSGNGDSSTSLHQEHWQYNRVSSGVGTSDAGDSEAQDRGASGAAPRTALPSAGRRGGHGAAAAAAAAAAEAAEEALNGNKKRRTRNDDQMEMNRIAQQKYRERKKAEQGALQGAVDMLTAQVAALKAVEVRSRELEASNAQLAATVSQQAGALSALQLQASSSAAELEAAKGQLAASQALVGSQQKMIIDQHQKLVLQEQIIASLKDRLRDKIDEAMSHVAPGTVCEKMVAAVKATLHEAKDQADLQESLSKLPEHLVVELCKNIFCLFKQEFPELHTKCAAMGMQAGGACKA